MKKINILVFLGFIFSFNPLFAQKQWQVQTSTVTFKIKNAGFNVDGKFGTVEASISFDANDLGNSRIDASIETKTINTGIDGRDNHLRKPDYFDATKFPKISMTSKKITKLANGNYEGIFDLVLKGTTKEIKIPFSYKENGSVATFVGEFTLNRLDYKVGGSSWMMSDNVTIKISVSVNSK
jgi:polyisoprenoid-binding protein YceI